MHWINLVLALLSGLCLIGLSSSIWTIFSHTASNKKGRKPYPLYNDLFERRKIRGILGAIGLLICLHQGVEALLFWIPNEWTYAGEDERLSYKHIITVIFSCFGTLLVIASLSEITKLIDTKEISEGDA